MKDNPNRTQNDISSVEELLAKRKEDQRAAKSESSHEQTEPSEVSETTVEADVIDEEDNSNTGIYISAISVVIVFALAILLLYLFGPVSTRRQASAFIGELENTINNEDAEEIALLFDNSKMEAILYLTNSRDELLLEDNPESAETIEQLNEILSVLEDRNIEFEDVEIEANSNLRAIARGKLILDNSGNSEDFEIDLRKVNDSWKVYSGLFDDFFEVLMEE